MKMSINIVITADGQVKADVVDGRGPACITEVLAGLEQLLGEADTTRLKPEHQWDTEVVQMLRQQEVGT